MWVVCFVFSLLMLNFGNIFQILQLVFVVLFACFQYKKETFVLRGHKRESNNKTKISLL